MAIYPEISEHIATRLENEIGSVVTSINNPTEIHSKSNSNITCMIKVADSSQVEIGDVLLIYDFLRGQIIAAEVEGHVIKSIDETRTDEHLFNSNAESGYRAFKSERYDFLRTPHLFTLEPIKLLEMVDGELKARGSVKFAPCPQAPIFPPLASETQTVLGLQDQGVSFGILARENDYWVFKDPKNQSEYLMNVKISLDMLTRHVSINGVSGSGKTLFIKYLLDQFFSNGLTILLTDTQGDFTLQLYRDKLQDWQRSEIDKDPEFQELINDASQIDYDKIGIDRTKIQVFYPPSLNKLKDPVLRKLAKDGVPHYPLSLPSKLVASWAVLAMIMPDLNSIQLQGLELLFNDYDDVLSQNEVGSANNEFNLQKFVSWVEERFDADISSSSKKGSDKFIAAGTKRVILRNLTSLLKKNILDTDVNNPTTYDKLMRSGYISILYLPSDSDDFDTRPLIQLLVYNEIYQNRTKTTEKRLIIIDEAQEVIPAEKQGDGDRIAAELSNQFTRLAEQGRKYGLCLVVASQQPRRMHKSVFTQCSTRLFLKLTSEDIDHLKRNIPDQYKSALVQLERGSALLSSPEEIERGQVWIKYPMPPIYHRRANELLKEIIDEQSLETEKRNFARSRKNNPTPDSSEEIEPRIVDDEKEDEEPWDASEF